MHRVDTEGHDNGQWRDGNPQVGQAGTIMSADWLNDTQENICRVIEGAAGTLDKGDGDQLKLAIQAMINAAKTEVITAIRIPVGTVINRDGAATPAGYLPLDGGDYLRATYPDLVAFYVAEGRLIAGSTGAHFKVPDYRGLFARAWSSDTAVDPDGPRAPGNVQTDQLKSHVHSVSPPSADSEGGAGRTVTGSTGTGETLPSYDTASTGGTETRPKNVALKWFVKV